MTLARRFIPRSIHGRMVTLSIVATLVALAVAAMAIGGVLERFVTQGLDQRLDAELALLATAVDDDGRVDRARLARVRGALAGPGWAWRIVAPGGTVSSTDFPTLAPGTPPPRPGDPPPPPFALPDRGYPQPVEGGGRDGPVHARTLAIETGAGFATLTAAAPRRILSRPIRAAMLPLLGALAILGAILAIATLIQLRVGLRPLRALRDDIAAIRDGRRDTLPVDQPDELRPLAVELNALIADNAAALAIARATAANLAHGLKTPVTTLNLALAEQGRDPDGALGAQVARIEATVRHHLARARGAITDPRAATPLAPALADLAAAMRRLHPDRTITIDCDVPDRLVAIDAHDLDELLGNLLDNAVRHAASRVSVSAVATGRVVTLGVVDDGPGIPAADRARATTPGIRLDERGDGHGFGLAIARDLAALHGGALTLDEAPGGGLAATVAIPLAAASPRPPS